MENKRKLTPNNKKNTGVKKLKVLISVVDIAKRDFYEDFLQQYEVNYQLILHGKGTADSSTLNLLGLSTDKAVIISFIKEENEKKIMNAIAEKFDTVKKGKGICFSIALDSIIGARVYRFLSNQK